MTLLALALALLGLLVPGGYLIAFDAARVTPGPASVGFTPAGDPLALIAASFERAWPATSSVDPEGYRRVLKTALAELDSDRPGASERAAAGLRSLGSVTLPEGTSVRPDIKTILAALESRPPDVATAKAGLRALLDEMDRSQALRGAGWGPDPRGRLQRILERPEFRTEPRPDPIGDFLRRLWQTLGDWLGPVVAPIGRWIEELGRRLWGDGSGRESLSVLPPLAGLVLVGGLVFWVVRSLRRAIGPAPVGALAGRAGAGMTAEGWHAEASRLAQGGDSRAAMRALYLAALLQWQERGKLRFDKAMTNREVLAKATSQGDQILIEALTPLVERFDRYWYGGVTCSPEDYADFARLAGTAWEPA